MKTIVVMPTYNERESLGKTIRNLIEFNPEVNLLIVDDNSPDGTSDEARRFAEQDSRITLLQRDSKGGLGPAYLAGFKFALAHNYELIVEMDADGSHRGEDLPALLAATDAADLVIGSRWVSGGRVVNWPRQRVWISRFGNTYARLLLGTEIRDMTAGFRVYRADLLRRLPLDSVASAGYAFQVELAWAAHQNGTVLEVPITFVERAEGKSKMTLAIVFEALTRVTLWGLKRIFS